MFFLKQNNSSNRALAWFLLLVLVDILLLSTKVPSFYEFGDLLWAEDGNIFINQAMEYGALSFFIPYAGYLHLIPRLISWLGIEWFIGDIPYLFFLSWVLIFLLSSWVVFLFVRNYSRSYFLSLIISSVIYFLPNNGEVFFTITNIQWVTAVALPLIIISGSNSIGSLLFIFFSGLTGPFIIFAVAAKNSIDIFLRQRFDRGRVNLVALFCAIVQFSLILNEDRVGDSVNHPVSEWLLYLYNIISIGAPSQYNFFSVCVWGLLVFSAFRSWRFVNVEERWDIYSILLYSLLLIISSAVLSKSSLDDLGGRYTFVPFALICLVGLVVASKKKSHFIASVVYISLFSYAFTTKMERQAVDYDAYQKLSLVAGSSNMRINPFWNDYPAWFVRFDGGYKGASKSYDLSQDDIIYANGNIDYGADYIGLNDVGGDPYVVIREVSCDGFDYVALTLDLDASEGGISQFFLDAESPSEASGVSFYVPAGATYQNYAMKGVGRPTRLRYDPVQNAANVRIKNIKVYCYS